MEAVAALGVAGNTVQFLDFATKLCATSIEIYRDADGISTKNAQAERLLKSFIETIDQVSSDLGMYSSTLDAASTKATERGDNNISLVITNCQTIAHDLLQRYQKLKSDGKPGKRKSFGKGVKCMWKKDELEELQKRLQEIRAELDTRILLSLRESSKLLASRQKDQFQELQSAMITSLTEVIHEQISVLPKWPHLLEELQQRLRDESMAASASRFNQPKKSAFRKRANDTTGLDYVNLPFEVDYAVDCAFELAEFEETQWRSLWFPVMDDREDQIAVAELKTFDWVLQPPQSRKRTWNSFIEWLEEQGAIYWISGKAGSGKSTMMKYLNSHNMVKKALASWAGSTPLVTASFFFWYNGNALQKTQEGLLRSLLYQSFENHRELIPIVLKEPVSLDGLTNPDRYWNLLRLKCAFKRLVEQKEVPLRMCLLVDGLDEYIGNHDDIAEVFQYAANFDHIKICVSSRPLLAFDRAFKRFPGLVLHDLTFDDIRTFVEVNFAKDDRFLELEVEEPGLGPSLALQVVNKASGVFLWVRLVVHSLLEGIQNFDRGIDLERRLNELPEDLIDLYWHMLDRLAFTELEAPKVKSSIDVISIERQNALCKSMAGRIKSRCLGLLEVENVDGLDQKHRRVQFLHKSVKDFVETPKMMMRIRDCLSKNGPFEPELVIVRALSIELATVRTRLRPYQLFSNNRLKREAWFDEVCPVMFEALRYASIAKAGGCKSWEGFGPSLMELDTTTNDLWNLAHRKPGATTPDEPGPQDLNINRNNQDEDVEDSDNEGFRLLENAVAEDFERLRRIRAAQSRKLSKHVTFIPGPLSGTDSDEINQQPNRLASVFLGQPKRNKQEEYRVLASNFGLKWGPKSEKGTSFLEACNKISVKDDQTISVLPATMTPLQMEQTSVWRKVKSKGRSLRGKFGSRSP
ncbi:Nn.00g101360.m01.CDS01 [Neocucurbitaria sp. VM-36]